MINRVSFIVDGFNLYHSVRIANRCLKKSTKWLNISKLCGAYLSPIRDIIKEQTTLQNIYYFSALAKHIEPADPYVTERHKSFIQCIKDTGVIVQLGRFKPKEIKCHHCKKIFIKHEEKETDVAIGLKVFEIFHKDECDTAVLVTGDTDLATVISSGKRIFPPKKILFLFPAFRGNRELAQLAPGSLKIKPKRYAQYQFPDPYVLSDGKAISKPVSW